MMTTRLIAVLICLFAAASFGPEADARQDNGGGERDFEGARDESYWESFIELRLSDHRRVDVRRLVIIDSKTSAFAVPLHNSVYGENADRIPGLGKIPIIGGLFRDRPDRDAFEAGKEIGTAHLSGDTLLVSLRPTSAEAKGTSGKEPGITDETLGPMIDSVLEKGREIPRSDIRLETASGEIFMPGGIRVANRSMLFDIRGSHVLRDDPDSGVPVLGKIPLTNTLFRNKVGDAYRDRDRLMILISPTVLRNEYE